MAAAIKAGATNILTWNQKDFPNDVLHSYDIETLDLDIFISELIEQSPQIICNSIKRCRQSLKNPPYEPINYLNKLRRQKLPGVVERLTPMLGDI